MPTSASPPPFRTRCPTAPCSVSATRPPRPRWSSPASIDKLDFDVEWANITGGPKTLEAFRADALDVGSVADIPPIHATWTGTRRADHRGPRVPSGPGGAPDVRAGHRARRRRDGPRGPEGKKIAYSPGQAQGALVLRVLQEAGPDAGRRGAGRAAQHRRRLRPRAGGKQVDVAPLGGGRRSSATSPSTARTAATTIPHGLRDDPSHLYVPTAVAGGPGQGRRPPAVRRASGRGPSVDRRAPRRVVAGLLRRGPGPVAEDGAYVVEQLGTPTCPTDWADAIDRHQETIDLLAEEQGRSRSTRRTSTTGASRRRSPRPREARREHRRLQARRTPRTASDATRPPRWRDQRAARRRLGPGRRIPFGFALGPVAAARAVGRGLRHRAAWTRARCPRRGPSSSTAGDLIASGRLQENLLTSAQRALLGLGIGVVVGHRPRPRRRAQPPRRGLHRRARAGQAGDPDPGADPAAHPVARHRRDDEGHHHRARRARAHLHPHPQRAARHRQPLRRAGRDRRRQPRRSSCASVVLPGALPGFLLGLRFAVTGAWLSLVVVEQVNSTSGIGYMMDAGPHLRPDRRDRRRPRGVRRARPRSPTGPSGSSQRKALSWRRTLAD